MPIRQTRCKAKRQRKGKARIVQISSEPVVHSALGSPCGAELQQRDAEKERGEERSAIACCRSAPAFFPLPALCAVAESVDVCSSLGFSMGPDHWF
ncbi:hypothetical protein AAFF_G00036150 [Aldrovandia affinis]|uniref:Uncharacterized protein n=1 Tax=Aldrovandia affinis TaxID=143900 RepID=A0AAD7WGI9_9TELE|nr:hypothetical protein AAFF_G00036150 [Aldrovandia affinis]